MYRPSFEEFCAHARHGNLIPVYTEILADLETPVSAFLKIDDGRYAYLLESVEGGEKWARYSFLGSRPTTVIEARGRRVEIRRESGSEVVEASDPLRVVEKIMADYTPVPVPGLPRFFGGAVGYWGYDLAPASFESLPMRDKPSLGFPDLCLMITDTLLIFDNVAQKIKIVSNAHVTGRPLREVYDESVAKIEALIAALRRPLSYAAPRPSAAPSPTPVSTLTHDEFVRMVERGKAYIAAGDVFQVVLSQRFDTVVTASAVDLYRALRVVNPSPYMYLLRLGSQAVVGSSPEVLVRCEDGVVGVRPIAGTRKRGAGEDDDARLARELAADEKERAEHLMLVDLGRNDVGRVAKIGSVRVEDFMVIERYSHVMHLVSHVRGELAEGKTPYDVLRACFPAGTLSGAPKIRAMAIIDELEPTRRGLYGGAVGYVSFTGNVDTCITIRTVVLDGGRAYIQAGAGIVADSDPTAEYEETVNKAKGMLAAIEMAERGLE
ncbi:MAG: anthranilate synthase component I [Nitrospiria bacterium]